MNLNIEESVPIEIRFEHDLINPITESVLLNSNLESINFEKPNFIDESVHIKLHAPEKLKIIVVGDHGVGKTSLIYRFKYDLFDPFAKSPNGYEVTLKDFQLHEKNYSLQFWDYNLEEKYEKIIKAFYRDANIILFCFDLSNLISFENIENYIEIAKSYINSNCSAFLIGTKKDVLPLIVSKEEIEKICAKEKIPFFELSARIDGDCDEFLRKVIRRYEGNRESKIYLSTEFRNEPQSKSRKDFIYSTELFIRKHDSVDFEADNKNKCVVF